MRYALLVLLIAGPLKVFSQIDSAEWRYAIQAIRETLPAYLDRDPNSLAYYLPGGEMDSMLTTMAKLVDFASSGDKQKKDEFEKETEQARRFMDSVKTVLQTQKINVGIPTELKPYVYAPDDPEWDLNDPESWAIERQGMLERFTTNDMVQLDQPIHAEYADLIRKQIDQRYPVATLGPLERLNNSYYVYSDLAQPSDDTMRVEIQEIYWPVFNRQKTRGCYLVTGSRYRSFIFIEKKNGAWHYVDEWYTHLIGDDVVDEPEESGSEDYEDEEYYDEEGE